MIVTDHLSKTFKLTSNRHKHYNIAMTAYKSRIKKEMSPKDALTIMPNKNKKKIDEDDLW